MMATLNKRVQSFNPLVAQPPMPIIPKPFLQALPLMSINMEQKEENPKKRKRYNFASGY